MLIYLFSYQKAKVFSKGVRDEFWVHSKWTWVSRVGWYRKRKFSCVCLEQRNGVVNSCEKKNPCICCELNILWRYGVILLCMQPQIQSKVSMFFLAFPVLPTLLVVSNSLGAPWNSRTFLEASCDPRKRSQSDSLVVPSQPSAAPSRNWDPRRRLVSHATQRNARIGFGRQIGHEESIRLSQAEESVGGSISGWWVDERQFAVSLARRLVA